MKKRNTLLVSLTLLVAMPCLYIASFMPLAYALRRGMITSAPAQYTLYYYGLPLAVLEAKGPGWARHFVSRYSRFLNTI